MGGCLLGASYQDRSDPPHRRAPLRWVLSQVVRGPGRRVVPVAALIAVAGAALALVVVLDTAVRVSDDPSLNAWGFVAIFLGIAAGYVLVLARAIRDR